MAFKMRGFSAGEGTGSTMAKKALVGAQNNLPEGLKSKIEAAPGKMYDKTMAKQKKKIKNKGKMEGPIPEQNLKLQPGENDGTWIYGRGYEGEDPKEGLAEMKADEKTTGKKFVRSERMIDYDDRAGYLEQNDLMDIEGDNSPEANKKRNKLKATIKTLDRERQIMKDRTPAKQTKFPNSPGAKKRKLKKLLKDIPKDIRNVIPDRPVGPSFYKIKPKLKETIKAEIKKRKAEGKLLKSKK